MIERINEDIKFALKNKQKKRLLVLRSLKSALKNKEIEMKRSLTENESLMIIKNQVKSREQAIELYEKGGRPELAQNERNEIVIIKEYLPKPLTEDEMMVYVEESIVELGASSMKDMGKVMKALTQKIGNKADGKTLSKLVKEKLSK